MFETLKKGYSRKRQNVKKNSRFEIQDMFVWYHCCAKRFGEISFLELAKKCTRPKQTKLNLDSVETNSSVSSSGAPETLESAEDCGSEIEEYDTQNNFREQWNKPVANFPKHDKKPLKTKNQEIEFTNVQLGLMQNISMVLEKRL